VRLLRENQLPLGRAFGEIEPCSEGPSGRETRPFGLSCATRPAATPTADLSKVGYDSERQVGVVQEGGEWVSLAKHSTGQTGTTTHPDGKGGNDSDTDQTED